MLAKDARKLADKQNNQTVGDLQAKLEEAVPVGLKWVHELINDMASGGHYDLLIICFAEKCFAGLNLNEDHKFELAGELAERIILILIKEGYSKCSYNRTKDTLFISWRGAKELEF